MPKSGEYLATYLNDHLTGAEAALELLETLEPHTDAAISMLATQLRPRIEEDRDELVRLMHAVDVSPSRARRAVGWIGEKTAELKLALDDPSDGGLRTLERLEALAIGIDGKRALWDALQTIARTIPALHEADYVRLARRAEEQRATVEARRLAYAKVAFTPGEPATVHAHRNG